MGILEETGSKKNWQDYLAYKTEKSHLSKREKAFLSLFIEKEDYRLITDTIINGDFLFSIPEKKLLNKHGKSKKRVVYTFSVRENTVLKLIAHLLYRYDYAQPPNCYSFRRNYCAKKAITAFITEKGIAEKYSCKLDIADYFNSIDVALLLPVLEKLLSDDIPLFRFLERLLTADKAVFNGEMISEKRGAMAGTPISPFLANVYLAEMDRFFLNAGILYARYSDDIIFFAATGEQLAEYLQLAEGFLEKYRLKVNPEKVKVTGPHEPWEYLGIAYDNGRIKLSGVTLKKIKAKIRRKARSIYRWKLRKGVDNKKAMAVFSRSLNKKFFGRGAEDEFSWARWFFPLLTWDGDLKVIDIYIQDYMRYLCTGRFNKANYRTRYSDIKNSGYRSLVNEYYRYKNRQ